MESNRSSITRRSAHFELSLLGVDDDFVFHHVDVRLHFQEASVILVREPDLLPLLEQLLRRLAVLHHAAHLLLEVFILLFLFLLQLEHPRSFVL